MRRLPMGWILKRGVLALVTALAVGCASIRGPALGLFTDTQSGVAATSSPAGTRSGEACISSILGISTGDASIETARRNGGITLISSVDESTFSILGIYGKYCLTVRGR